MQLPFPLAPFLFAFTILFGSLPGRAAADGGGLVVAQVPGSQPLGAGGVPIIAAPPTVVPQNPSDSRVPNLGSGGGTLGRPSAIPNPLGYDDSLYFRRPKVPAPPPVVLPEPSRRVVDPPAPSTPRALRSKPKGERTGPSAD